jgi:hypothetical protein
MGVWGYGSNGRVSTLQTQSPEFKPHSCQKKKKSNGGGGVAGISTLG